MSGKNLFAFDVDGTLAEINRPVMPVLAETLRALAERHYIVLASGKPFCYLAGLARQLQLSECTIIAENGSVICFGARFPPRKRVVAPIDNAYFEFVAEIRSEIQSRFESKVWLQPNEVNLTVFPLADGVMPELVAFVNENSSDCARIYFHADSVDFMPTGINKGVALQSVLKEFDFDLGKSVVYAFGDGENDLPMLQVATRALVVGNKLMTETNWGGVRDISELSSVLSALLVSDKGI